METLLVNWQDEVKRILKTPCDDSDTTITYAMRTITMQFSSPFLAPVVIILQQIDKLWSVIKRHAVIVLKSCVQRTCMKF